MKWESNSGANSRQDCGAHQARGAQEGKHGWRGWEKNPAPSGVRSEWEKTRRGKGEFQEESRSEWGMHGV